MLTPPAVLFPDAKAWAITYLKAELLARPVGDTYADNVTVLDRAPETIPTRLVTIRNDSGPRREVTKTCSLGVNVWAESVEVCTDLANLVVAILEASPGNGPVTAHRNTSGPYEVPEESTKPHQYASVDLDFRGSAL